MLRSVDILCDLYICNCPNDDAAVAYENLSSVTGDCVKGDTLKFENPYLRNQLIDMALTTCENQGCTCDRSVPLTNWARRPGTM